MLYLDEVVIHNFKSFKHAVIRFNKGFNCIVGPNGSGKSNICDSLLFAMGEMSLKRMRASSSLQLINNFAKPGDDKLKRAFVKVRFAGDKELEVSRSIRSNKKVGYRLNGKRATRQEVLEVLRAYKADMNETNTMTQGEITYLLNLTPREKRELIDVAAGIREFDEKKDAAMRELEKVDIKINEAKGILHERLGFLHELEKEKQDAERYLELTNVVKRSNFTLLKMREKEVQERYEDAVRLIAEKSEEKRKLEKKVSELESQLSSITADRDKLTKTLNAKNAEAGSTNKVLEEVNKSLAITTTQLNALNESIDAAKERASELKKEQERIREKEKENADTLKKLGFELEVKKKSIPNAEESVEDASSGNLSEKYEANYKKSEQIEGELLSSSSELAQSQSEYESIEKNALDLQKSLNELGAKRGALTLRIKSSKDALGNLDKSRHQVANELEEEKKRSAELKEKSDKLYEEHTNVREQLAVAGRSRDSSASVLKKSVKSGFYGRAQDLCEFEDKYALAVQAAAGARFNYFIVDSAYTASEAIEILKKDRLGRASFIPLKEVSIKGPKAPKGLTPLIDLVKFDKEYAPAFSYIFSNTYLVNSINDAKKEGIGAHRFVTLDGDIIDMSGIITGGSMSPSSVPAVLEAKLKKLDLEKKAILEKIGESATAISMLQKKLANYETEVINYDIALKTSLDSENDVNREMDALEAKVKAIEERKKILRAKIDTSKAEKERAEHNLKALKEESARLRAQIEGVIAQKGKSPKAKEEAEKAKKLREELEELKIRIATITKESDMLKARIADLDQETKRETTLLASSREKAKQMETSIKELEKQKKELQEVMESQDKKTTGLFKEIKELEEKAGQLGFEKGKANSESERMSRDTIELGGRREQYQTRLSDIKAELMSYQNIEELKGMKSDELDKQLIISKNELERLGAVNLKAPEMYDTKKKDAEESQQKMEILGSEKESIMSMIEQIETKKMAIFSETLATVNENFQKLYGYIFDGSASLHLQDQKDPFNSGLLIKTKLGSKEMNADQFSGGQKSLLMLMLIFAIQMRKPMSLYIFDEIDIALDKENTKKLSKLIKEMSQKSQFVVVSHNDSLIAAADTAVGVVNKANESQVVGVQLTSK